MLSDYEKRMDRENKKEEKQFLLEEKKIERQDAKISKKLKRLFIKLKNELTPRQQEMLYKITECYHDLSTID